jgi:hypothetical protein
MANQALSLYRPFNKQVKVLTHIIENRTFRKEVSFVLLYLSKKFLHQKVRPFFMQRPSFTGMTYISTMQQKRKSFWLIDNFV